MLDVHTCIVCVGVGSLWRVGGLGIGMKGGRLEVRRIGGMGRGREGRGAG